MTRSINADTPCDLCGQPLGEHTVPVNPLDNFPGFSGSTAEARFGGVPFVGMQCPTEEERP